MVQHCHEPFDDQLVRLYTSKVYLEYKQVFDKSTTFRIYPNPGVPNGSLMKHQGGGCGLCWSNLALRVHADVEKGEYRCECRQWEHATKLLMITNIMFHMLHDSCCCVYC
jgi:hypothetical protein